jgi:superfamily II DNA helicase RecQ
VLDVECVIQYGVCRDITNLVQRGGRAGRATSTPALLLILYEPWVMTADLSSFKQDLSDPDQPLKAITKTSKKPERTGVAMYQLIHSSGCIRLFFANYFHDTTPNGGFSSYGLVHLRIDIQLRVLQTNSAAISTMTGLTWLISFQGGFKVKRLKRSYSLIKQPARAPQNQNIVQKRSANN